MCKGIFLFQVGRILFTWDEKRFIQSQRVKEGPDERVSNDM